MRHSAAVNANVALSLEDQGLLSQDLQMQSCVLGCVGEAKRERRMWTIMQILRIWSPGLVPRIGADSSAFA